MSRHVAYLSYNGVREPLVRSQVLNYLERLTARGYRYTLITWERDRIPPAEAADLRASLAEANIQWLQVTGTKWGKPFTSLLDVGRGRRVLSLLHHEDPVDLVHARSLIAALAGCLSGNSAPKLLYDTRGLWVDEKVYKGSLRRGGLLYRGAKRLERKAYRSADGIVSLAAAGLPVILAERGDDLERVPAKVIPTCVEIDRYEATPVQRRKAIIYLGSLGPGYLPREVGSAFRVLRELEPSWNLQVWTRSERLFVDRLLDEVDAALGATEIAPLAADEVPERLLQARLAICFIEADASKAASCPTKLGEYLAAGLPVLVNDGCGDVRSIVESKRVGVCVQGFDDHELKRGLRELLKLEAEQGVRERCRSAAREVFSLEGGVNAYAELYAEILDDQSERGSSS